MGKTLLSICVTLMTFLPVKSQDTLDIKYYKSVDDIFTCVKPLGRVVEYTIQGLPGEKTYILKEVKSQKTLRIKRYINNEPSGKWFYAPTNISEEPLEFKYNKNEYSGLIKYDLIENKTNGNLTEDFKPPEFDPNISFLQFVGLGVQYPLSAKERGILGTVISQFVISKSGEITNFSILESANIELDKEVARLILKSPRWKPAESGGKPIDIYIIFPTHFVLN